jgi:hypothetical protein
MAGMIFDARCQSGITDIRNAVKLNENGLIGRVQNVSNSYRNRFFFYFIKTE